MYQLMGHPALCTSNPDENVVIGKAVPQQCKQLQNKAECEFEIGKNLFFIDISYLLILSGVHNGWGFALYVARKREET